MNLHVANNNDYFVAREIELDSYSTRELGKTISI